MWIFTLLLIVTAPGTSNNDVGMLIATNLSQGECESLADRYRRRVDIDEKGNTITYKTFCSKGYLI